MIQEPLPALINNLGQSDITTNPQITLETSVGDPLADVKRAKGQLLERLNACQQPQLVAQAFEKICDVNMVQDPNRTGLHFDEKLLHPVNPPGNFDPDAGWKLYSDETQTGTNFDIFSEKPTQVWSSGGRYTFRSPGVTETDLRIEKTGPRQDVFELIISRDDKTSRINLGTNPLYVRTLKAISAYLLEGTDNLPKDKPEMTRKIVTKLISVSDSLPPVEQPRDVIGRAGGSESRTQIEFTPEQKQIVEGYPPHLQAALVTLMRNLAALNITDATIPKALLQSSTFKSLLTQEVETKLINENLYDRQSEHDIFRGLDEGVVQLSRDNAGIDHEGGITAEESVRLKPVLLQARNFANGIKAILLTTKILESNFESRALLTDNRLIIGDVLGNIFEPTLKNPHGDPNRATELSQAVRKFVTLTHDLVMMPGMVSANTTKDVIVRKKLGQI